MTYRCFMIWFLQHSLPGLPLLFVIFWVLFLSLFSLAMLADFSAFLLSHFSFLPVNSTNQVICSWIIAQTAVHSFPSFITAISAWIGLYWQPKMHKQSFLKCLYRFSKLFKTSELNHIFWKVAKYNQPKVPKWITCLCWWSFCDLIDAFFLKTHLGTNATINHSVLFILLKCDKF